MRIKKRLCEFFLLCILFYFEMVLVNKYRQTILNFFKFLNYESQNIYDDVLVGIVGSVIFSVMNFINIFLIEGIVIYSRKTFIFIIQSVFSCGKNNIEKANNSMMNFLFSTNVKWGVYQKTDVIKMANTSEGIIACISAVCNGYALTSEQRDELLNVLKRMMRELSEEGYKSYNENIYTVHCTSMGLFAIKKAVDTGLIEISDEEEEKIKKCLKKLLNNANDLGWGFKNEYYTEKEYNRALSSLWAFRALNAWGFSGHKKYIEILGNFVGHTEGLIGFSCENTAKSSATALLWILANEIENKKTKNMLLSKISYKKVLSFLLKNFKNEIEVEEFIISLSGTKKLPWTHLSECLTLEAMAFSLNEISVLQIVRFFYYLRNAIKKINSTHHYYTVASMNFSHNNPFFYPTTYLIMALCNIINKMESVK